MAFELWTAERQLAARLACRAYAGTPHVNRLNLPGEGVDCVHFVLAVLTAAQLVPAGIRLPAYDERLGRLRERNVIEDILLAHLHCERIEGPEFGALVVCKCGRQSNHVGIAIDGDLWHVPGKGRCGPEAIGPWIPRVQSFLRITAPGLRADPAELTAAGILAFAPAAPAG